MNVNVILNVSHIYETPWENKMKLYPETKIDQSIEQFIAPYNTNDKLKELKADYTIDNLNAEFKSLTNIKSDISMYEIYKIVCRAYSFKGYKVNDTQISEKFKWQDVYDDDTEENLNKKLKSDCPIILKIIQTKINDFVENINLGKFTSNDVFKIGGGGIFSVDQTEYEPEYKELGFNKIVTIDGKVQKSVESNGYSITAAKANRHHKTFSFFLGGGIDQQERINTDDTWNNRKWKRGDHTFKFGDVEQGIHLTFILDTSFITTNQNDKFFVAGDIFGQCSQPRNQLWKVGTDKYMATIKIPYGGKYETIYYNYYKNPSTDNSYLTSEKINTTNGFRKLVITSANGYEAGKNYRINDYFGSTKHNQNKGDGEIIYKKLKFSLDVNSVTDLKDSDTFYIGGGYFGNANAFKLTKKNDKIYESGIIKIPNEFNFDNYKLTYAYYKNLNGALEFTKKEKLFGPLTISDIVRDSKWNDRILTISNNEDVESKNDFFGFGSDKAVNLEYKLVIKNKNYDELNRINTMDMNDYTAFKVEDLKNVYLEFQNKNINNIFIKDNVIIKVNKAFENSNFFNINTNAKKRNLPTPVYDKTNGKYYINLINPGDLGNNIQLDNLKFTFDIKSLNSRFTLKNNDIQNNKFLIYYPHEKIKLRSKNIDIYQQNVQYKEGTITIRPGNDNNYKFTIRIENVNRHNTLIEFDFPDNDYFEIKSKKIHNEDIKGNDDKKKLIIRPMFKNQDITFGLKDLTDEKFKELLDNGTVIEFPKYKQDDHQKLLKLVTLKNTNAERSKLGYEVDKSYDMYPTDGTGNTFYKKGLPDIEDNQLFSILFNNSVINQYKIKVEPAKLNFLQTKDWLTLHKNFYKKDNWNDNMDLELRVYFFEKPSPIEYKFTLTPPSGVNNNEKIKVTKYFNKTIFNDVKTFKTNLNGRDYNLYYFNVNPYYKEFV